MNRTKLLRILRANGAHQDRSGGNHDIWKRGSKSAPVPRHREISEGTVRSILRQLGIPKI